jgi:hypothetical protein
MNDTEQEGEDPRLLQIQESADSINSWLTVGLNLWRLVKPQSHFLR